jgi:hypothetical protein
LKIDHVSVGGSDLRKMEDAFAAAGLKTVYGGPHSSGLTKMSLLGFRDGSYIELISPVERGMKPSIWAKQIEGDGGPCAWAIAVEDIAAEVARAKALGIQARGPEDYSRKRPDGVSVEWQLGFLGEEEPGALLPFMIKDTTPRDYRVKPSPSVSGSDSVLKGIENVVIGVEDIQRPASLFRKLYGWPEAEERSDLWEGATLAFFEGAPVMLAAPTGPGWLRERLSKFGTSPCAFLIGTESIGAASRRYDLEDPQSWFEDRTTRWFAALKKSGMLIGLVGG